jgi:hypothetical protein
MGIKFSLSINCFHTDSSRAFWRRETNLTSVVWKGLLQHVLKLQQGNLPVISADEMISSSYETTEQQNILLRASRRTE